MAGGNIMAHYFIAIPIPEDLQHVYNGWQKELRIALPYKKWMHPEDLHITLKFLGEANEGSVTALIKKVSQLSLPKSFIIELGTIGFFGKYDQPRVLWVDVKKRNELLRLQTEIEAALYTIGFEKEKRDYRPHMTLAKKWKGVSVLADDRRRTLQEKYSLKQRFSVQEITLFRIHPNKTPSYEEVAKFPLL